MPYANTIHWLFFNKEEFEVRDEYLTAINTYAEEMVSKMILGLEPIDKFDEMVSEINKMGLSKLLAAYESAFARTK